MRWMQLVKTLRSRLGGLSAWAQGLLARWRAPAGRREHEALALPGASAAVTTSAPPMLTTSTSSMSSTSSTSSMSSTSAATVTTSATVTANAAVDTPPMITTATTIAAPLARASFEATEATAPHAAAAELPPPARVTLDPALARALRVIPELDLRETRTPSPEVDAPRPRPRPREGAQPRPAGAIDALDPAIGAAVVRRFFTRLGAAEAPPLTGEGWPQMAVERFFVALTGPRLALVRSGAVVVAEEPRVLADAFAGFVWD